MSLLSADSFALALFSLMKLGKDARDSYVDSKILKNKDVQELGTKIFTTLARNAGLTDPSVAMAQADALFATSEQLRSWAARTAAAAGMFDLDAEFDGVVPLTGGDRKIPLFADNKLVVTDETRFLEVIRLQIKKSDELKGVQAQADKVMIEYQKAEWLKAHKAGGGKSASPWTAFAANMLDFSLDIVAEDPKLLGGGRKAREIIAAVMPTIALAYDAKDPAKANIAHRLPTIFAQAAMGILIEKPDLVSSETRWQRLITGVLTPLQAEVAANGTRALAAEGRLRSLIEGELAPVALRIVSENSDDYLKGGAASDRIAGVVLRATLGEYTSSEPGAAKVRKLFGREGIERIVFHSLDAARTRPELFIRQNARSTADDTLRTTLASIAGLFAKDGQVNPLDGGLATNLYCIALDSVGAYMMNRVKAGPNASLQGQLGAELATFLISDILEGLKSAPNAPPGSNSLTLLTARFGQDKLGDMFKIVADYATRSPNIFLGKDKNPFLIDVARMLASAILDDEDGLLSTDEWQAVALASADAALENPFTLFGRLMDKPEEDFIARKLIQLFLRKAKANFDGQKGTAGQILFGKVLQEAIIATIDAASTGVLNILAEKVQVEERLLAVEGLIDKLNALAASKDPSLVIGSRDWIRIYTRHITDVLHRGQAALDELSTGALLEAIMDNSTRTATSEGTG